MKDLSFIVFKPLSLDIKGVYRSNYNWFFDRQRYRAISCPLVADGGARPKSLMSRLFSRFGRSESIAPKVRRYQLAENSYIELPTTIEKEWRPVVHLDQKDITPDNNNFVISVPRRQHSNGSLVDYEFDYILMKIDPSTLNVTYKTFIGSMHNINTASLIDKIDLVVNKIDCVVTSSDAAIDVSTAAASPEPSAQAFTSSGGAGSLSFPSVMPPLICAAQLAPRKLKTPEIFDPGKLLELMRSNPEKVDPLFCKPANIYSTMITYRNRPCPRISIDQLDSRLELFAQHLKEAFADLGVNLSPEIYVIPTSGKGVNLDILLIMFRQLYLDGADIPDDPYNIYDELKKYGMLDENFTQGLSTEYIEIPRGTVFVEDAAIKRTAYVQYLEHSRAPSTPEDDANFYTPLYNILIDKSKALTTFSPVFYDDEARAMVASAGRSASEIIRRQGKEEFSKKAVL